MCQRQVLSEPEPGSFIRREVITVALYSVEEVSIEPIGVPILGGGGGGGGGSFHPTHPSSRSLMEKAESKTYNNTNLTVHAI